MASTHNTTEIALTDIININYRSWRSEPAITWCSTGEEKHVGNTGTVMYQVTGFYVSWFKTPVHCLLVEMD